MKANILYFLTISLFLSSCRKEIDLDLPNYIEKIVINGELNSEDNFSLQVSKSFGINQSFDTLGLLLNTATVQFYENGALLGNGTYLGGRYTVPFKAQPDTEYKIVASNANFRTASATVRTPSALNFSLQYLDSIDKDIDGFRIGQLTFILKDVPNQANYYSILVRYYNQPINQWLDYDIVSNDPIFFQTKQTDGSYLFSDKTFSGNTKTVSINLPYDFTIYSPKFEVLVKSIDADYYTYIQQVQEYNQTGVGILDNPVIVKSNIKDGLGFVGAISSQKTFVN